MIDSRFFTSALVGGEWSASGPGHFTLGKAAAWAPEPVWTIHRSIAFKYKCFRNTRHTVTFGIPL
jgi:hypothetical protein